MRSHFCQGQEERTSPTDLWVLYHLDWRGARDLCGLGAPQTKSSLLVGSLVLTGKLGELTYAIPERRRQRPEDCFELKASMGYIERPCLITEQHS